MSGRDICERLEASTVGMGARDAWKYAAFLSVGDAVEAAATIRDLREMLRRADALLAEGIGAAEEGDTANWRARVRAFLGERS